MERAASSRARWFILIGIPLFAFVSLVAWSLASPVGSSPDDDFHLPSIWCGAGERPGLCEVSDASTDRLIPTAIVNAPCFAFHPDIDAACWDPSTTGMTKVARANADGLYPPVFYAVMSIFASDDIQRSVIVMRVVNSAFAVALLTGAFFALPRRVRPALIVSVLATAVPLGLFIYASTNPSSWALLSAAVLWPSLYGATQTTGRRRLVLAVLSVFAAVIGAGARADAAVFAVFGTALALFLGVASIRKWRTQVVPGIAAALILAISLGFYFTARQGGAALGGLDPSTRRLSLGQHLSNLLEVPSLWTGALGQANLGWFDTRMPAAVWVLSTTVFAGALFVGIRGARGRRIIAVAVSLAAMWIVPFALLAQSNALVGSTVQPRYILPLLIIALGVATLRIDVERAWDGLRYWLAGTCLVVGSTVALHQNIQRYTTGSEGDSVDPGAGAQWWWTGAPSPVLTWAIGSLAFAGVVVLLWVAKQWWESNDDEVAAARSVHPASQIDASTSAQPLPRRVT